MNFEDLLNDFLSWSLKNGIKLILGIIILVVGWKLIKKVITTLNNFLEKKGFDSTLHSFLDALINISLKIIYVFLTIFLYLLKCPQSLILSALRAFCFCGKPHISRSIFLYFRYQSWLKSW